MGWAAHSPRLQSLINEEIPGGVQYLSFRLQSVTGEDEISGYCVANYLHRIDCLDRQRTIVWRDWNPVNPLGDFSVREAVLSRPLIGEHRLFRVLGNSGTVVIREDLKARLEAEGITGCVFNEIPISDDK